MKMRKMQREACIPKAAFARAAREISDGMLESVFNQKKRWSRKALDTLHAEAELYMAERFAGAQKMCELFGRSTVCVRHLGRKLRMDVRAPVEEAQNGRESE